MASRAFDAQPGRSIDAARQALSGLPPDTSLDQMFRQACELSANALAVERVSVWLFIERRTVLRCANLFERSTGEHSSGTLLRVADFPTYFASLTIFKAVPAEIAATDAWTVELAASYLRPLGITSMLDVGLFVNENLMGVICHEHVGPPRVWSEDARQFAVTVADLLSERLQAANVKELRATFMTQRERLAVTEKNAALEQLATGVVSHFKSLLVAFQGSGERIGLNQDVPPAARPQMAQPRVAAERDAAPIDEFVRLGRQESGPPQVLDLSGEISECLPALRMSTGPRYQLRYTPVGTLGYVLIERSRFTQLLSHLVRNACDAMPDGGPVEINVSNARLIGDSNHSSLFVLLEVTDHGAGLDEAALMHVMEPSDAPTSDLSLAIVPLIVERAGGFMSIESAPGRGTTFKVFFSRIGTGERPSDRGAMALVSQS
jgi:signal transduction histidine kinase